VAYEVGGAGFPSLACVDATEAEAVLPELVFGGVRNVFGDGGGGGVHGEKA